jgi:hypothetical protein
MIDDQRNNWSTSPAIVDRQAREPSCPSLRSHMLESYVKIAWLSSDSDARKGMPAARSYPARPQWLWSIVGTNVT